MNEQLTKLGMCIGHLCESTIMTILGFVGAVAMILCFCCAFMLLLTIDAGQVAAMRFKSYEASCRMGMWARKLDDWFTKEICFE